MLDPDNEGVMYTYSDAGEGKNLSFEPSGFYISDHFTIAEMLNWVPTQPTRERTSFTGIWGDASPGDVVVRYEYSDLQYDAAGRLIGWNGNAVNSWSCGGKIF